MKEQTDEEYFETMGYAKLKEVMVDGGIMLYDIPVRYRTPEMCLLFLKRHPDHLKDVPKELQNKEFYLKVFKVNPAIGKFIGSDMLLEVCSMYTMENMKGFSRDQLLTHKSHGIREIGSYTLDLL